MKLKKYNSFYCSMLAVFMVNILSKGIGFIRETLMASYFGTSEVTDAFLMANSIVNIFFSLLTAISLLYIPLLAVDLEQNKNLKEEKTFQFIQLFIVITLILGSLIFLFKGKILRIVASGFKESLLLLTEQFFFFSITGFLLITVNQLLIYKLNYYKIFFRANLTTLVLSCVQILGIIWSYKTGNLFFLNISQTTGCFFQMMLLIKLLRSCDIKMKFCWLNTAFSKKVLMLSAPIILSAIVDDANVMIDKAFASNLEVGIISSMNYAHILKQLIFFVLISSSISVMYPKVANLIVKEKIRPLNQLVRIFLWCVELAIIPITIGVILYSNDIVRFTYERGAFNRQSTIITGQIFAMYALALFPLAIRELLQRVLYSYQDTRNTFQINLIMSLTNIGLNIVLFYPLKQIGLALSTAISAFISLPFYINCMQKKGIFVDIKFLISEGLFTLVISIISIVPFFAFYKKTMGSIYTMLGWILLSVMFYSLLMFVFRSKKMIHIKNEKLD